jgi:hypothetical protein
VNYTIFTREQVSPKYITAHGAREDFQTLNPGPAPRYPVGSTLYYQPADLDIYSDDPAFRRVLLVDPAGSATGAEIFAAFPGLKKTQLSIARAQISSELAKTDYMVIKEVELIGYTMPAMVKADRQALRDRYNTYEAAVNACTTIDELLAVRLTP